MVEFVSNSTHMSAINDGASTELIRSIDDDAARKLSPLRVSSTQHAWHNFLIGSCDDCKSCKSQNQKLHPVKFYDGQT